MPVPSKPCRSCGRRITWRKKWARDWESVLYCSSGCRARGVTADDLRLETVVRQLVARSGSGVSDADIARAAAGHDVADLEPARRAARRLVAADEVEIVQGGRVVDPSTAAGPILVRRRRR